MVEEVKNNERQEENSNKETESVVSTEPTESSGSITTGESPSEKNSTTESQPGTVQESTVNGANPQTGTVPPGSVPPRPTSSVMLKTRTPEDRIKYLNILNHGDSGSGKTNFCGTMIKSGIKTLFLTFSEHELMTLDQLGLFGYDYILIDNYERQLWPIYTALRKNSKKYEGVIIDGLGDFQQMAKDFDLSEHQVNSVFMEKAMKGQVRMALRNWGNLLEMTRHWIDPMLQLPIHKIVTCISEPDDDPITGRPKIYPGLQGSMQQIIAAHFSVVAYSFVMSYGPNMYYAMTTAPNESIATKDRTRMARVFINPQFKVFLDAINGKPTKATENEITLQKALIVKPQTSKVDTSKMQNN